MIKVEQVKMNNKKRFKMASKKLTIIDELKKLGSNSYKSKAKVSDPLQT